ncbi:MAG TPA: alpha/beta fold hydrolase [Bryobacteraceae bacterium]|nr:alpha/beta fold hydrolase [Bryobacteraceae bacterium]
MQGEIQVSGAVLKYERFGAGLPLVVLHGGPGVGYRYMLPELREALNGCGELIFYDQRASGHSTGAERPDLLTIDVFVEDLAQVCPARAMILGHSFGGLLAMQFGVRHPNRVSAMILVDGDPASRRLWQQHTGRIGPVTADRAGDAAAWWQAAMAPRFANRASMPADFGQRLADARPENLLGVAAAVRASLGDWDLHGELHRIASPVLVVRGDKSIYPDEAFSILCANLPDAELVTLPNASHFPFIEAAAEFREAVRGFIRRVRRPADRSPRPAAQG